MSYEYKENAGNIIITAYGGNVVGETLFVPEKINGLPVTAIGDNAFALNRSVKKLSLPDCVAEIGEGAFRNCVIEAVRLPAGLVKLSARAFLSCVHLIRARIPDGTAEIGDAAFYGCAVLTRVILPDSLNKLGYNIFNNCPALGSIRCGENSCARRWAEENGYGDKLHYEYEDMPDGVKLLKYIGFEKKHKTPAFVKGKRVIELGEGLYRGTAPESVELPDGVTEISKQCFAGCGKLEAVVLPRTLEFIGAEAFMECHSLKTIVLPPKISVISRKTFAYCEKLEFVETRGDIVSIAEDAFEECHSLKTVKCGEDSFTALWAAENGYEVIG